MGVILKDKMSQEFAFGIIGFAENYKLKGMNLTCYLLARAFGLALMMNIQANL